MAETEGIQKKTLSDRKNVCAIIFSGCNHPQNSSLDIVLKLCKFSRVQEILHISMGTIFSQAIQLIITADAALLEIVVLSLRVTLTAVGLSCVIGLPIGAVLGAVSFPGRGLVNVTLNALMGLPPVVVGLVVYLTLSNSGPLGVLQLLYTPTAMIIAQTILVLPIVTALTRQMVEDLNAEYADHFSSLGVRLHQRVAALIWDGRHRLMTTVLAGFGRAIAEVGAVMIVGGNINHATRVMTTAIALESSKGNLELALALGVILLLVALIVNGLAMTIRGSTLRAAYA